MLEEPGSQQTRRWWTLAGQEITVTYNRFMVRRAASARGPEESCWGHTARAEGRTWNGASEQEAGMWCM